LRKKLHNQENYQKKQIEKEAKKFPEKSSKKEKKDLEKEDGL